jgi:hypothetical protein
MGRLCDICESNEATHVVENNKQVCDECRPIEEDHIKCETCQDNGCDNCSPGELPKDTLTEESILKRLMIRWILEQHQDEGLRECDITEQDIRNNIVEGAGVYGSEQALMFSLVEYYALGYNVEKDKPSSTSDLIVFKRLLENTLKMDMAQGIRVQYSQTLNRVDTEILSRFK